MFLRLLRTVSSIGLEIALLLVVRCRTYGSQCDRLGQLRHAAACG